MTGQRNRRNLFQLAVATTAVTAIAGIGVVSALGHSSQDAAGADLVATVRIGNPDAPVAVAVTEDLQCPYCKKLEAAAGRTLTELTETGRVAVDYHVIAFLDRASSTDYSSRAANASACIALADKAKWPAWHRLIFEKQPAEHGVGLSDDTLIALAEQADVNTSDVGRCIRTGKYRPLVAAATKRAWAGGLKQTPTVTVNGTATGTSKVPTAEEIQAAVARVER